MRLLCLVLVLGGGCLGIRPRGVRVELASLYNPGAEFSCFDGSGSIPFIQVNDDYCDCDDGSDEPGTSACPEGKFYCENKGHKSLIIPSSRVNDGICDCCDGSDEWEAGTLCQNTCMEAGRAAREEAAARAKIALEGFNLKQSMAEEGRRVYDEKSVEVIEKEKRQAALEAERDVKKQAKENAEGPEKEALDFYRQIEEEERKKEEELEQRKRDYAAEETFFSLDSDQDGSVTVAELMKRPELDTNKDGEVSEEEAKFFISGGDAFDLETFKLTGYVLLKPYLDLHAEAAANAAAEEVVTLAPEENYDIPEPETYDHTEAPATEVKYNERGETIEYTPEYDEDDEEKDDEDEDDYEAPEDDDDHAGHEDDEEKAPEEEVKEEPKYDAQTQHLINAANAARKAYDDIDSELRDVKREIINLKKVVELDYGENHEFGPLHGQCFEYTDNEYTYKMCAFDYCSQRGKHGGSETRLGNWEEWKGPEGDRYSKMKFSGGQGCWNGPARSSLIHVECGTDNQLTAVSEPNRCEYEMKFTTPAACRKPEPLPHDEL